MFEDHIHDGMFAAQFIQNSRRGGVMSAGCFSASIGRFQSKAVEQHFGKLLCRIDIERLADGIEDLLLDLRQALGQLNGHLFEEGQVEQDPFHLHLRQDGRKRQIDLMQKFFAIRAFEFIHLKFHQSQRDLRICDRVRRDGLDGNFRHAELLFALADQLFDVGHLFAEFDEGKVLQAKIT